ncbi:MAG: AMP-binding protein [Christensenellaceae bacterium]|jgi:long-chain acyl-CoA synthetase
MKKHPEIPTELLYDNFKDYLVEIKRKYGGKTAITTFTRRGEEVAYDFTRLAEDAEAFAEVLLQNGYEKKHIAIAGENSYHWIVAYLGIVASGNVAVCIDVEQSDEIMREMIQEADAALVVTTSDLLSIFRPLAEEQEISFVLMDKSNTFETMEEIFAEGRALLAGENARYPSLTIDPAQVAVIVYTSGTTSASKPVMLTQQGVLFNASAGIYLAPEFARGFCSLPFHHAFGMTCAVLGCIVMGYNLCINGDLKTLLRDIETFQPEAMVGVPLLIETFHKIIWAEIEKTGKKGLIEFLIRAGKVFGNPKLFMPKKVTDAIRKSPIGSIRLILSGGAHIHKSIPEDLYAFGILVLSGYGITECSPVVSAGLPEAVNFASVGHVLPRHAVKFIEGEIYVQGPSLMKGYYKQEALTEETLVDG